MMALPAVTALVPSYNHARYLKQRIESILGQTYGNVDLIVIDDCSDDDSDRIIQDLRTQYDFRYIRNARNSGTPFAAWETGARLAEGRYIWICESDDYADGTFLDVAVKELEKDQQAVLFYCDSEVIDGEGRIVDHTDTYFHEIWCESRWDRGFTRPGIEELKEFQLRGQTVPNMSSALMRTQAFKRAYHPFLKRLRLTGDWLFVGLLMQLGSVIYCKKTLNFFRQHEVTSRFRVKSARSQAEFILTKYLLFRAANRPVHEFATLMRSDAIRFLHEPANCFDLLRELAGVSVRQTARCGSFLGASLLSRRDYVKKFVQHRKVIKGVK